MRPNPLRSRQLLIGGLIAAFVSIAALAFHSSRPSNPPARAAIATPATPVTPSTSTPAADHPGFISHSPHYTLTADIHAGS